jgi:hypothetical protein
MTNRRRRRLYLYAFFAAFAPVLALAYLAHAYQEAIPRWLRPLVDGYGGNLSSEIVGGLLFLLLALFLDAQTEEKIDNIRDVTSKSEALLSERERLLRNERTIRQFEEFLRRESYHDVRLTDLSPKPGLEYTIIPVRDPVTGEPRRRETEMDTKYLVKVQGPAHWEVMDAEERKKYETSPIRNGEYYFCHFFNDSWHLGSDSVLPEPHRFYLSGKVGPGEWGESANAFMRTFDDPFKNLEKVAHLLLALDGTTMKGRAGGCDQYDIYRDSEGGLFLRIHDSPPKKLYYTNPPNSFDDNGWFLVIADVMGHASGQKLANIKQAIQEKLAALDLAPPKIWWHETDEYRYERA